MQWQVLSFSAESMGEPMRFKTLNKRMLLLCRFQAQVRPQVFVNGLGERVANGLVAVLIRVYDPLTVVAEHLLEHLNFLSPVCRSQKIEFEQHWPRRNHVPEHHYAEDLGLFVLEPRRSRDGRPFARSVLQASMTHAQQQSVGHERAELLQALDLRRRELERAASERNVRACCGFNVVLHLRDFIGTRCSYERRKLRRWVVGSEAVDGFDYQLPRASSLASHCTAECWRGRPAQRSFQSYSQWPRP